MKSILKWTAKFIIAILLLMVHWSLFLVFIALLFWRSQIQYKRKLEEQSLAEAEQQNAQKLIFECEIINPTANNADGVNRQEVLFKCYRGDELTFKLSEAANSGQVEVWSRFGQIGDLAPDYAQQVAELIQQGLFVNGRIKKILNRAENASGISCQIEVMTEK